MVFFYYITKHFHQPTQTSSVTFFSSLQIYTYIRNRKFLALLEVIDRLAFIVFIFYSSLSLVIAE